MMGHGTRILIPKKLQHPSVGDLVPFHMGILVDKINGSSTFYEKYKSITAFVKKNINTFYTFQIYILYRTL